MLYYVQPLCFCDKMTSVDTSEATVPTPADFPSTDRTGPDEPERAGRRNACNQCKQQKVRSFPYDADRLRPGWYFTIRWTRTNQWALCSAYM